MLTLCAMAEEKQKSPQLKPEIVRALTELFLVVENLAQEWGVEQELMVGTLTQEALHTWLEKVGQPTSSYAVFVVRSVYPFVHPHKLLLLLCQSISDA